MKTPEILRAFVEPPQMINSIPFLIGMILSAVGASALWQEVVVEGQPGTREAYRDGILILLGLLIWFIAAFMDRGRG